MLSFFCRLLRHPFRGRAYSTNYAFTVVPIHPNGDVLRATVLTCVFCPHRIEVPGE